MGKEIPLHSLAYLNDPGSDFKPETLLNTRQDWVAAGGDNLNLGFTSDVVWVRFFVDPRSAEGETLLEIANHKITHLQLYVARKGDAAHWQVRQSFVASDSLPLSERVYPHRHFIFPLALSPDRESQVLLRIENDYPVRLPLNLMQEAAFHQRDVDRTLFHGFYFGTVLIMAFYNLFIYFYVKDKSYATYVIFIVLFSAIVAVDKGLASQYLWPGHMEHDFRIYVVLVALGAASSVWFTVNFLSLREHAPRMLKGFYGLMTFWLVLAAVAIALPSKWVLMVEMIVLLPGGAALLWAGIYSWQKGVAAAPYYCISWCVVIFGVFIYACYLLGLLPVSLVTEYSLQVGNIIEATLLSLGLAHRIKELDREKQLADAKSEAKSEFLATMSHEIRTPMNGILGMAQLLRDTRLTQQQVSYLNTILGSGQTLLTVLNDILDYSKIEAGKLDMEHIHFNVRRLVDETAGVFAVKATEKGIYYNTYVAPRVPIKIKGDPTRVRQILTNFLSNAFKFTNTGRVTIYVKRGLEMNQLRFEVHDSGIGIPQDKLASVFEEFSQADSSTSRQYGGTGLGLPISRRLVEMMGGSIGVDSVMGRGSVFWFSLPIEGEIPFDRMPDRKDVPSMEKFRFLQLSPDEEFLSQTRAYSEFWKFGLVTKHSIHGAVSEIDPSEPPFDYLIVDQYCEDFSYEAVSRELMQQPWAKGAQPILTMKPGSDRLAFEQLKPAPWIEEYPVSITRIQFRFLGKQGVKLKQPTSADLSQSFANMRVLLVEDNPVNARVAVAFLKKLGIKPKAVDSGEEALELVCHEKRDFDLILMDCEMPGIDGYTTSRHIRDWELLHHQEPVRICALSAHAMDAHRTKCLDSGMNDFLTKPLVFEELRQKVAQAFAETRIEQSAD
ncbi:MAG: 7TM diverse intracellular signaling domain-containing protein [Ketobacteraceae bacterium]|nr:7TM diverse intracellular signaling domain-containing protein [Ketobacteraceae bacterium]